MIDSLRNLRKALHLFTVCVLVLVIGNRTQAQEVAPQQKIIPENNQSSQRYEINQTFDRQAFFKDNNIWVYNKDFADLFGMPVKYIEDVQGIAAAAFRIEDTSFQQCGFGGQVNACRKIEECLLDLYFNESETPLPWATDIKSQWQPAYASMRWLRPLDSRERPHGMLAVEPAGGIIRNEILNGQIISFADPGSKREAIFTTNARVGEHSGWSMSGAMAILGYTRDFYRGISVVNLQFGCTVPTRKTIDIRLDAKKDVFDDPIAQFNKVLLPENFVQRIKDVLKAQSDKNAVFYRSLFASPR